MDSFIAFAEKVFTGYIIILAVFFLIAYITMRIHNWRGFK